MQYLNNKFKYYTFNGMVMCKQHVTHEGLNNKNNTIYKYPEDCILDQKTLIASGHDFLEMDIELDTLGANSDGGGYLAGKIGLAIGPDIDSWAHSPTTLASFFNRVGRNDIDIGGSGLHWETIDDTEGYTGAQDLIPLSRFYYPGNLDAKVRLKEIADSIDKDIFTVYIYYTQHKGRDFYSSAKAIFVNFHISVPDGLTGWNSAGLLENKFGFIDFGNTVSISNFNNSYKYEDMMSTSISGMALTDFSDSGIMAENEIQNKICCLGAIEYDTVEQKIWWIQNHNIFSILNQH